MSNLIVYVSSISSNMEIKKQQQHIEFVLSSLKIEFETVDISLSTEHRDKMREVTNNPTALPPQFCRGSEYLGSYDDFNDAVENKNLSEFLKCSIQE